jgi:hypothetical protein
MKFADLSAMVLVLALLACPAPLLAKNSKGGASTGAKSSSSKSSAGTAVGNIVVGVGPAPGATLSTRATTMVGRDRATSVVIQAPATMAVVVPRLRQPCDPKVGLIFGGFTGFRSVRVIDQTFVLLDAAPPEAQVFLDGAFLGTAAELVARALPVRPGEHFIHIVAPGFRPYAARLSTDPAGFPMRVRAALQPE